MVILGHHYQQDQVIEFADFVGDSFELSRRAAEQKGIEFVVFCGVHFMAESADILTDENVRVILPDLGAGCSMADMANLDQTLVAWEQLAETCPGQTIVPITYMNSSAAIKAFVGEHGGAVCTSSNCRAVLEWAIGTEVHLINRLAHQHPEQKIIVLSDCQCLCTTMFRIDLKHLCWAVENLVAGNVVNEIKVDAHTRKWATVALERMLTIKSLG